MREPARMFGSEANKLDQYLDALRLLLLRVAGIPERLGDIGRDPQARMKRGVRILEHELDVPSHASQRLTLQCDQILAAKQNLAGGRLDEFQKAAAQCGLAAPGFPNEAERLSG